MTVHLREYEDEHGGNLFRGNVPSFGQVDKVNLETGRVSGHLIDMARTFDNAFVVMPGGVSWGTSFMPQTGDIVQVVYNINNVPMVIPFSANYGGAILDVDTAANRGFKQLIEGEMHQHSSAHAEVLWDGMGSWTALDSVGDMVQLDAASATIRMRAWQQMVQEFGFNDDGSAGVTVTAGMISDAATEYGSMYGPDDSDSTIFHPNASTYHIVSSGDITFDVKDPSTGNVLSIVINQSGVWIDPGPDDGSVPVTIGSGDISVPVLYSKLAVKAPNGDELPIDSFAQIGSSKTVRIAVKSTDTNLEVGQQ